MKKILCSIYSFTNLINNKKYIGSTIQSPNIRYNQHIYNAKHENSTQYNYPLYCAFRKYGLENFKFDIIYQTMCSEEEIRLIEAEYIQKFNTLSPNGYNQSSSTLHPINSFETYSKISNTKRNQAKEVALVDENNNIIKVFRSVVDCAEELGLDERKISACCRGERKTTQKKRFSWLNENNELIIPEYKYLFFKGKNGTTQKQITNKKVAKIDKDSNEILCIYESIALASRENSCDGSGISKTCKGKRSLCGGFKWKYIE